MALVQVDSTTVKGGVEVVTSSLAVGGGTVYVVAAHGLSSPAAPPSVGCFFQPSGQASLRRNLPLVTARSDTGAVLTATAAAGAMGIARTAGTSLTLVGETTNANGLTDKAIFDVVLPDSYMAGADIPVTINAGTSGAGTLTLATSSMTLAAYSVVNGVETALVVSAARLIPAAAADLAFTITGTGLTPGERVVLELVMLITTSAGARTGVVNSVSYQA